MIAEIEDFFGAYKDAAWRKDFKAMIGLYDERALLFDMWENAYIRDANEWANQIENWLGSLGEENVHVEFEMVEIHQSENLGFATALVAFEAISTEGVVLRSLKNRISLGFTRRENGWTVIHQHTSVPITFEGLVGVLKF